MINLLKKTINNLLEKIKWFRCKKMIVLRGENYKFSRSCNISLSDGSSKEDIVLEDDVYLYGVLSSQNGGKIYIGKHVWIGSNTVIGSVKSVIIGDYSLISNNITIMDNNNHPINPEDRMIMRISGESSEYGLWKNSDSKPIIIGRNVWIGTNSRINKGVSIGDNSIIAASAVVTKDVPANSIAAGNPAIIVKRDIHQTPRKFTSL